MPDEKIEYVQQNRLYSSIFNENIKKILSEGGVFISQSGSSTWWQNSTLHSAYERCQSSFNSTVYFEMDELNWVWLLGANFKCDDVAKRMINKLDKLLYKPTFIDSDSIIKSTMPPYTLRHKDRIIK